MDLALVEATEARYAARGAERAGVRRARAEGRLAGDAPERVAKRLARLSAQAPAPRGRVEAEATDVDVVVLERLIGKDDLIGVEFLVRGAAAARSVARIVVRSGPDLIDGFGTGFLVAPGLLLTNNHVLGDAAAATHSQAEFDFSVAADGAPLAPVAFALEPATFFATNPALDFTVVAVAAQSGSRSLAEFGWTPLIEAEGKVILNELLNIVQHPNGETKQLALRENRLVDLVENFLHYETDTAPGSSGSPVFNDQWEVVGLHHSGVPRRDGQGRILARNGQPWTQAMGDDAIDWVANEGVRVSRICKHLRSLPLTGDQAALRDRILAAQAPESVPTAAPSPNGRPVVVVGPSPASDGATVTVPIELTIRLGAGIGAPPPPPVQPPTNPPPATGEVGEALVRLGEARRTRYYDEAADLRAAGAYYAGINPDAGRDELFAALAELVSSTHHTTPRYKPHVELYPDVDLQPDGQLQSIYTGEVFAPEQLIVEDARTEARRGQLRQLRLAEVAGTADELASLDEELEAALPFNCEHVVPQSWFGKAEPMRGDLHHLFTCQMECNSFRGNTPYFDFDDFGEAVRERCGKRDGNRFEPQVGKGQAARAVFYFLLRYPGLIDATAAELDESRLATLVGWHEAFPVTLYERHRNARIHQRQGNRNPFVDHPAWVAAVPLGHGLGGAARAAALTAVG